MVRNTRLIEFKDVVNTECGSGYMGHLVPIEGEGDVPFQINRLYYITDVPKGSVRGFHSHEDLEQVLICVSGSVKIKTCIPGNEEHILLDKANKGLYVGPMVWREMYDFSEGAVLLVLASKHYNEKDYIRDYDVYCEMALKYFEGDGKDVNSI